MPDILIRGLASATVEHIDTAATRLGLSRNEYLRRHLDANVPATDRPRLTVDDLRRASDATADLLDPTVMDAAWR